MENPHAETLWQNCAEMDSRGKECANKNKMNVKYYKIHNAGLSIRVYLQKPSDVSCFDVVLKDTTTNLNPDILS